MYKVKFYRDRNDRSKIVEYLDELKEHGKTSKTERINGKRRRVKSNRRE